MATKDTRSTASGESGRRGEDVRSDVWVRVEQHSSGGIALDLQSKVETYYGDAIRSQVRAMCESVGLSDGRIEMEDRGALPFTIAARFECAVRRLSGDVKEAILPEPLAHASNVTARDRLRRSRLYLPGNEPKFLVNAALYGADAVILDLEDAVAASEKDAARILVRNALRSVDFGDAERMVRINPGDIGHEDLEYIAPQAPNLILIPKCESEGQVLEIDESVQALRKKHNIETPIWLMPIVESALGVENASAIASASPHVAALTIGLEDYTADMGVERTLEGRESLYARMVLVNAAKAARVQAIDSVFSDVADMEGLRNSALEAKALGFEGKGCIHPRQIPVLHEAFAPTKGEVEKAKKIVLAFERATAEKLGVVSLGTKMIDPPVVKRAQHSVDLAVQLGLLPAQWRQEGQAS